MRLKKSEDPGEILLDRARTDLIRVLRAAVVVHTVAAIQVSAYDTTRLSQQHFLAHEAVATLFECKSDFEHGPVRPPSPAPGMTGDPSADGAISWPRIREFVRLWYLVMAARLHGVTNFGLLKTTLDWGLERFRGDPELLLARGCLFEARAGLQLVDRSLARQIYMPDALTEWRSTIAEAADDFDAARRKDPKLLEATLRWGRTRLLAGDEKDAKTAFATVIRSGAPAGLRYLAFLFDGARAEATKRLDEARDHYQQALTVIPRAPSALLSLSRLNEKSGDSAAARAWIGKAFRNSPADVDPWGTYYWAQS